MCFSTTVVLCCRVNNILIKRFNIYTNIGVGGQKKKLEGRALHMNEYSERGVGVGVELMVKHFLVSMVALLMVQRLSINLSITYSYRNYYYYQLLYSSLERRERERERIRVSLRLKPESKTGISDMHLQGRNYTTLFRL